MKLEKNTLKNPEAKARRAFRSGRWKLGAQILEEQLRSNGEDFAKWNLIGDLKFRAGEREAALTLWRRALDGYMQEALHENALGVARKVVRMIPEEVDVYLSISEAYLGLEYYADAISAFRTFIKLNKSSSLGERKNWFRKLLSCDVKHLHLIEEIQHILAESHLEDIELERDVKRWAEQMSIVHEAVAIAPESESFEPISISAQEAISDEEMGLATLGESDSEFHMPYPISNVETRDEGAEVKYSYNVDHDFEVPSEKSEEPLPEGQGKDHYDLGVVYAEMKLWDAAMTEFQTARRDRSMRGRATIELAQCFKNANDPHRALRLLEEESALGQYESSIQDDIAYELGVLHQLVGNTSDAIEYLAQIGHQSAHHADAAHRLAELKAQ